MSTAGVLDLLLAEARQGERRMGDDPTDTPSRQLAATARRNELKGALAEQRAAAVEECLEAKEPATWIAKRHGLSSSQILQWLNAHYEAHPEETRRHLRLRYGPGEKTPDKWVRGETPTEKAARRGNAAAVKPPKPPGAAEKKAARVARTAHARDVLNSRMRDDPEYKRAIVDKRNKSKAARAAERLQQAPEPTSTTTQLSRPQPPASQVERRQQQRLPLSHDYEDDGGHGVNVGELMAIIERQKREIEILRETAREALEERKTLRGMVEIMQREAADRADRRRS